MLEDELISVKYVRRLSVLSNIFDAGLKSIEIHVGVKVCQVLLIVSLSVELKDSNVQLLDIFQIYFDRNFFVYLENLFINFSKLQDDSFRYRSELFKCDCSVLKGCKSISCLQNSHLCYNWLQNVSFKVLFEFLETSFRNNAKMAEILHY